jgi:hypothetical protein
VAELHFLLVGESAMFANPHIFTSPFIGKIANHLPGNILNDYDIYSGGTNMWSNPLSFALLRLHLVFS